MINPLLRTFLTVADCGSFTKASEKLFISATAIMKQMNTLEAHLQLQLIQRSPNGITLTSAGGSSIAIPRKCRKWHKKP